MLIELPVLRHLRANTKAMLKDNIVAVNGTESSLESTELSDLSRLRRIVVSRINCQVDTNFRVSSSLPKLAITVHERRRSHFWILHWSTRSTQNSMAKLTPL